MIDAGICVSDGMHGAGVGGGMATMGGPQYQIEPPRILFYFNIQQTRDTHDTPTHRGRRRKRHTRVAVAPGQLPSRHTLTNRLFLSSFYNRTPFNILFCREHRIGGAFIKFNRDPGAVCFERSTTLASLSTSCHNSQGTTGRQGNGRRKGGKRERKGMASRENVGRRLQVGKAWAEWNELVCCVHDTQQLDLIHPC